MAISNPPSAPRIAVALPSNITLEWNASACFTTSAFLYIPAASTPVPGPTASRGSIPVNAQSSALAEVVLPIPISPTPAMSVFPRTSAASATPFRRACCNCASVMAAPWQKLAVPRPNLRSIAPGTGSASTPASTIMGVIPNCLHRTVIAAPPPRKLCSICPVTSFGYLLTPSAVTP